MQQYPQAISLARRAIRDADSAEAEIVLGDALYDGATTGRLQGESRQQAFTQAVAALRDGLRIDRTPYLAGNALDAAGQPQAALTAYQSAFQWYGFDLANRVLVVAAPGEGYASMRMVGGGYGYGVLTARSQAVEEVLAKGGA